MESLQGSLLVASPRLRDPNFARAVVLMIRHGDEGALGLILNRPLETSFQELWSNVSETPCQYGGSLYLGGPVKGPLMALHRRKSLSEFDVLPGVHFCAESEKLERLVAEPENKVRFFIGYAGWGEGQLERELDEGAWLIAAAKAEHVFDQRDDLWEKVSREIASASLLDVLKVKHVPPDPSLN